MGKRFHIRTTNLIEPSSLIETVMHESGNTEDIMATVLYADRLAPQFTKRQAQRLRGMNERLSCRRIFQFVKNSVRYKEDRRGHEVIKSPGALKALGTGDCKSLAVMTASMLHNLGIGYEYWFVAWERGKVTHVYPVAITKMGERIAMDTVHGTFDDELPFHHAEVYNPGTKRWYRVKGDAIGGTGGPGPGGFGRLLKTAVVVWAGYQLIKRYA